MRPDNNTLKAIAAEQLKESDALFSQWNIFSDAVAKKYGGGPPWAKKNVPEGSTYLAGVYNDDFIDMSFTSSHLMIGSDKVKTSKRFNREIYTTISNLYSKLEKEKFDSKIDSLVTEVREFKEFKENKNKNK